jgi:Bacterial membrane protein YfhO
MPAKRIVAVGLLLLLLGTIVFRDFVFGSKLLLYKDIGSDSLNFHYPYFIHLSDYLRRDGLPRWSFNVGLGQNIFPYVGSLLLDPVVWLPRTLIAKALVYQHLLKAIICGLLFFRFLELRRVHFAASLLGGMLLSLSAYLCMGSCWTNVGNEAVCLTFVLFAVEKAITTGRWFYLPLAVACCGILTPFHLYFAALLLTAYTVTRLFAAEGRKLSLKAKTCLQLAAVALLGVGLAACVWLDALSAILDSPRGSGVASYANKLVSFPVFGLETPLHYTTAMLRQFCNEIMGTGTDFRGWQNYLEAPLGYCGLFCLLMMPQVFVGANTRRRVSYLIFLVGIVVPMFFPWFRYLFWLFQGDYYRTFSLFSVFGIIGLSMMALSRYIERGVINLWLLCVTLIGLLTILYLPIRGWQVVVDPKIRHVATILLYAYTALVIAGQYFRKESIAGWAIVALCAIELCYFDHITVAARPTVTKPELSERVGYNDYTVEAVRDIQASDREIYRITKLYSSGPAMHKSLNDAMIFSYYDTASYSSFNNVNYIRFLMALNVMPEVATENDTRWALGLLSRRQASAFVGEKYILTMNPVSFQIDPAFEYKKRYNKIYVFQSKLFHPLGLFFTSLVPEADFRRLPTSTKEDILKSAVVLGLDEAGGASDLEQLAPELTSAGKRSSDLGLISFNENRITGEIQCDKVGVLVLQTPFDRGWQSWVDQRRTNTVKVDIGLLGVTLTPGKHVVEMRYLPPFLKTGAAVTAVALLLFVVGLRRWPRISSTLI